MTEPTGYTAVGMVGFTDKGTYSASASYVKNDLVHYGGSIWCCLIDDTTGITPTEGANWTLFVGEPINMAERIIAPLEVSPSESAYSVGEQLIFNDVLYKAKTAIAVGDALVVDTNIELAPKVTSQIQTLTNETNTIVNELGAKNLLNNSLTTQVNYGVTYTKNTDGSILVSGTATGRYSGVLITPTIHLPKGKYILSGCPSGGKVGDTVKYNLYVNDGNSTIAMDTGDGAEFELLVDTDIHASIAIVENETVNATYYPMIRPSSIVDSTYVPYAMTNRELTEEIELNDASISVAENVGITILQQNSFYSKTGIKCIEIQFKVTTNIAANTTIMNAPSELKPKGYTEIISMDSNEGTLIPFLMGANGSITNKGALPTGYYVATNAYR